MRPLNQLDNSALSVLKTALDGYQRFGESQPEFSVYLKKIIEALVGPVDDLNVWAIRNLINEEGDRRILNTTVKAVDPKSWKDIQELSAHELRILKLIGEGHKLETIANLLSISYQTVMNHKTRISKKLGLGSARELIRFAQANLQTL